MAYSVIVAKPSISRYGLIKDKCSQRYTYPSSIGGGIKFTKMPRERNGHLNRKLRCRYGWQRTNARKTEGEADEKLKYWTQKQRGEPTFNFVNSESYQIF